LATVLSAAMMFDYAFEMKAEAQAISEVVNKSLVEGVVTEDIAEGGKAYKTSEVGDWLAENV
jgi:3-isopropylmalate dehydrogenase